MRKEFENQKKGNSRRTKNKYMVIVVLNITLILLLLNTGGFQYRSSDDSLVLSEVDQFNPTEDFKSTNIDSPNYISESNNLGLSSHQNVAMDPIENFSGPYQENELNSYNFTDRLDLFDNNYNILNGTFGAYSYIADMMTDDQGNLYVLAGYDDLNTIPESILSWVTSTGNEDSTTFAPVGGFIFKFDKNQNLLYGSVLDPGFDDIMFGSFVQDDLGFIYILGVTGAIFSNEINDRRDIYILKLDSNFNYVNEIALFGGSSLETIGLRNSITDSQIRRYVVDDLLAIDSNGDLILTGSTMASGESPDFPVIKPTGTSENWDLNWDGQDAFIVKIANNLTIQWSRTYGADLSDELVGALVIGSDDKIYIGGTAGDLIPMGLPFPYQDTTMASYRDAFVAVFYPNGTLYTATFLGSRTNAEVDGNDDYIYAMALTEDDNLFVAGETWGNVEFPIVDGNYNWSSSIDYADEHYNEGTFITYFNTLDWNITFSTRFDSEKSAAIMEMEYINGNLYFTGITENDNIDPVPPIINTISTFGPYADHTFDRGAWSPPSASRTFASFFGVLNSTRDTVFLSYTDYDQGLEQGSGFNQQTATGRPKLLVNHTNGEVTLGLEDLSGIYINRFNILDTDLDGLSDYNEMNIYLTDPTLKDTDSDGLSDGEEVHTFFSNPNDVDTDGDCLDDYYETQNGLNLLIPDANADFDGDGLSAFDEHEFGTNPEMADTDQDGLNDYDETVVYFTNPLLGDGDGDGYNDSVELGLGFDPNDYDMDDDGLNDKVENEVTYLVNGIPTKTDPRDSDSDDDGLIDGVETAILPTPSNPLIVDTDGDGLTDYEEYLIFASDPANADMDGDGLNDTEELVIYFTNVTNADIDNDGLNDYQEVVLYGTNPWKADIDNDGLNDNEEVLTYNTDPWNADTDGDGLNDFIEVITYGSNPNNKDTDNDLLPDYWEYTMGLDSSLNETYLDTDNDNLTTIMEFYNNTHPLFADIDGDTLNDFEELILGTDPWSNDTDGDDLLDNDEINIYLTDPKLKDSDGDGLIDGYEIRNSLNPLDADMDDDLLLDGAEIDFGTDPKNNDTDSDGLLDGTEVLYNYDPFDDDTDDDGLKDGEEVLTYFTNPLLKDSDDDGIDDGDELAIFTNPNASDTDNDMLSDGFEISIGTDPLLNDTDNDGLSDGVEVIITRTDPNNNDTDGDGMIDGWEILYMYLDDVQYLDPLTNDAAADPDNDNLSNFNEFLERTDPRNPDTDGDGSNDGWEASRSDRDPLDPSDAGSGEFTDNVQEGFDQNPALAWGSGIAAILAFGVFAHTLWNWWLKRRSP